MTALAGVWSPEGALAPAASCRRMLSAQKIYGPDGEALADWGIVALGRCLFETLPEDRYDRGPCESDDGRYLLVGDVRLDDRDQLVDALEMARGDALRLSDSALLLRAWQRWGEDCFAHLYGSYAFAVWDVAEKRLILARDHIGTRPLHYHLGKGFVAFASMPKGLHALAEIPYAPDEVRAAELLALLPETGPRSFFQGIDRVEGGHFVVIDREGARTHRHWNPTRESIGVWQGSDPVAALRAQLDAAVAACLRGADGQVGSHLSGGLDSGAVTATAARLMAGTGGRLTAFTAVPRPGYAGAVPKGRIADEGPLAAETAALYPNIDHVRVGSAPGAMGDGWDRSFHLLDRPLLNPCNDRWWSAINAEAGRRGIRIMLTGEMGNMTISYAGLERLSELVRKGAWWQLWRDGRALVGKGKMRWRGVAALALGPWIPAWLWSRLRSGPATSGRVEHYTALHPDRVRSLDFARLARERGLDPSYRPRKDGFETRLWVLRRIDKGNFLKAAIGASGIDQRDPTADRRLIEFCLSLPTHLFLAGGVPGALGRRVLADRLPASVLEERRRGYQAADWHESIAAGRQGLAEDLARLEDLETAALLDLPRMRALAAELPEGGWEKPELIERYRMTLLRGSAVGHFLRRASRSNL